MEKQPKKDQDPKVAAKARTKRQKVDRPFPRVSLQESLIIGQKIKELNGGNPWTPQDIAKAVNIGFATNKFYYYTAASRDFGITDGSSKTDKISLTDFGRSLLYAPDPSTEQKKKNDAFLSIPIFKRVLDHYKGSTLPEMKYLRNTLENEFGLHPDVHEEFASLFKENCKYLDINSGNTGELINNDSESPATIIVGESGKSAKKGLKAFVIMPFSERNDKRSKGFFNEVLSSLIVPAGIEAGFNVETANKQGTEIIQSTIINELIDADMVIADLTDHNPNVLFELGVRMALDKPVAIIKSQDTGRVFDVDNMLRVQEYNQNLWRSTVESDLPKLTEHFKATWENRKSDQTYLKILRKK